MARKRESLQLRVPGRPVDDVVEELRAQRPRGGVRLRCGEDGQVRITEAGRSNPPDFRGQLRQEGADTVLDGEVRETRLGRFNDVLFVVLAAFMFAVAVLLAVGNIRDEAPGIAVCGICALLFLGIVVAGRKLRGRAFTAQAELYRNLLVTRLGIEPPMPVHLPDPDDEEARRFSALSLALYDRLHRGALLRDCGPEVDALADVLTGEGFSRAEADRAVEALAVEFAKSSVEEQAKILDQLRAQRASGL